MENACKEHSMQNLYLKITHAVYNNSKSLSKIWSRSFDISWEFDVSSFISFELVILKSFLNLKNCSKFVYLSSLDLPLVAWRVVEESVKRIFKPFNKAIDV